MAERFHVVTTGEVLANAEPEQVAARLARLFKMPEEKARLLLGGQPRVVKKDADEATARKFQVALRQAGARCELKPVDGGAPAPSTAPAPQASSAEAAPASASGDLETVGTIRTGGEGFTGAFEVAPVGADMDPTERADPAPAPDVSHLSMAEPGEDLGPIRRAEAPPAPDISHLSLRED